MTNKTQLLQQGLNTCAQVIALAILVASLAALFTMVDIATWGLAPYDSTPLELRPPQGAWQREVSDFFQSPPGSVLLPALATVASVILLAVAHKRTQGAVSPTRLMWSFSLTNVLVAAGIVTSVFIFSTLPIELSAYPGYGWTIKYLIPHSLLLACLFVLQGRVISQRFVAQS